MDEIKKPLGTARLWITWVVPFLLPALLFQSALFAFISPLPLFILTLKNRLWVALLALSANIALTYAVGVHSEAAVIAVFWFAIGILFPFLIRKSGKIQFSYFLSFVYLVLMIFLGLYFLSQEAHLGLIEYVRGEIALAMDHLIAMPDSPVKTLVDEQGKDALFKQLMTELPSGILGGLVLSLWINLFFASVMIRGFLAKTFWSSYRTPEWLVWPTLICGALSVWGEHAPYYIGLTGLKVVLVLYGFQGLSVMAYLLNHYKIEKFPRFLLIVFIVVLAMPLVFSMGFFDLWFDFRRKFVQS